ncbi:glycosyltransferase family 10 domain-containing protein [Salegentibacter sp. Hel_I_6]|uniref:glycosyltransferase family 10 domain-containing protein n=1 Tax=Salegentibacter sp. Hel_I_6 TaxID=1250278 RepID=UPI000568D017|nr:glycosyltransferase family 10 [Salegentibacter sp. Hel_I_6]
MKKEIKIWFSDFTNDINPKNNYLTILLSKDYKLIFDENNPDYLIFSSFGYDFLNYKDAIRIYYSGENVLPDFNLCDYGIGFHFLDFNDRYLRFPLFAIMEDQFKEVLLSRTNTIETLKEKSFFCNYIYSNANANPFRDNFYHFLNEYKMVHSVGTHLRNYEFDVGGRYTKDWMYSKLDFQSKCKFTIAFENSFCPGYTTEKILHAFISNTIPIYWGNPEVTKDFNPNSFINCHDYKSLEDILKRVKELDNNDTLYLDMLNAPALIDNTIPYHLSQNKLLDFFKVIFNQKKEEAFRRPKYGYIERFEKKLFNLNFRKSRLQIIKHNLKKRFN